MNKNLKKIISDTANQLEQDTGVEQKINWDHAELVARAMIQEFKNLCEEENGRRLGEIDLGIVLDDMFGKKPKTTKKMKM